MHPVLASANPFKALPPPPLPHVPEGYVLVEREVLEGLYAAIEQIRRERMPAFLAAPSPAYLEMLATTSP